MSKTKDQTIEDIEKRLRELNGEDLLKVFLKSIRERLRAKDLENLAVIQEIMRELEQAGI